MSLAAVVLTFLPLCGIVRPEVAESFSEQQLRFTGGRYDKTQFSYQLHEPTHIEVGKLYPLLVWLHGYGENGVDKVAHLRWLDRVLTPTNSESQEEFFILALQCPPDNPTWSRGSLPGDDDMIEVVLAAITDCMGSRPVDPDRIYATGVSSGGSGVWEIGIRRPKLFAALVPIAAGPIDSVRIEALKDVPVWAFHNKKDPALSVANAINAVDSLNAAGGAAALTETSGVDHDAWTEAFRTHHAMDWLLLQARGHQSPRPGYSVWVMATQWFANAWDAPSFYLPTGLIALAGWSTWCFWTRPSGNPTTDAETDSFGAAEHVNNPADE